MDCVSRGLHVLGGSFIMLQSNIFARKMNAFWLMLRAFLIFLVGGRCLVRCCKEPLEVSKEFQIKLDTRLFTSRDPGVNQLYAYLNSLENVFVFKIKFGFKITPTGKLLGRMTIRFRMTRQRLICVICEPTILKMAISLRSQLNWDSGNGSLRPTKTYSNFTFGYSNSKYLSMPAARIPSSP